MARHAKLSTNASTHQLLSNSKRSFLGRFVFRSNKAQIARPVRNFVKRVASVSAAFFIISSFSVFDNYFQISVQGYGYEYEGVPVDDFTNQDISEIMANVSETDGFVMKSNGIEGESDRSEANEIVKYQVKAGDTADSIAAQYQISKETVLMTNNFYDANQIKEGMVIDILGVNGITHIVQKGDTLSGIAKKYKIEVADIMRQNQLEEDDSITPNMALIIPGASKVVEPPKPVYVGTSTKSSKGSSGNNSSSSLPSYNGYVYDGPVPAGGYIWPVPNGCRVTQGYHGGHYAMDCANKQGGPIIALTGGSVIKTNTSGYGGGYGLHLVVQDGEGNQQLYAHCKELYVSEGQTVNPGDLLCAMGSTGRSTGPHLHLEFRTAAGNKIDPQTLF